MYFVFFKSTIKLHSVPPLQGVNVMRMTDMEVTERIIQVNKNYCKEIVASHILTLNLKSVTSRDFNQKHLMLCQDFIFSPFVFLFFLSFLSPLLL